ncbi:hypothetical protein [Zavarzinella formosa]|uniref:hypothetical protein n=1 Tax=Zavarzinella formosa TaxID=360055 RepID=UPI00035F7827|nr:hypothetical protein [Zavarzinella formosa]
MIKPADAGHGLIYPRSLAGLRSVFAEYASYPAWWLDAKPAEVVEASAALRNLTRYAGWQLPLSASKKKSKSE